MANKVTITRKDDLKFIQSLSDIELAGWLLQCLVDHDVTPLETFTVPDDPSYVSFLCNIYYSLDRQKNRIIFEKAVANAIDDWDTIIDSNILIQLANIAGEIHAKEAIVTLGQLINNSQTYFPDDSERYDVLDTLVSVIRGFIPGSEKAYNALLQWYESPSFDSGFLSQIILSLCQYSPQKFYKHIDLLLKFAYQYNVQNGSSLIHILDQIDEIVSTKTILSRLHLLRKDTRREFINLMYFSEHSPYERVVSLSQPSEDHTYFENAELVLSLKIEPENTFTFRIWDYPQSYRKAIYEEFRSTESVSPLLETYSRKTTSTFRQMMAVASAG